MQKRFIAISYPDNSNELFDTSSEDETLHIAKKFASHLNGGDVVLLHGNLGAGKTVFAKGIAKELGIANEITSPTFTIMNVYPIKHKKTITTLCHIDAYRIKNQNEVRELGIEEYLGNPSVITLIEWPENLAISYPSQTIDISLSDANQ